MRMLKLDADSSRTLRIMFLGPNQKNFRIAAQGSSTFEESRRFFATTVMNVKKLLRKQPPTVCLRTISRIPKRLRIHNRY